MEQTFADLLSDAFSETSVPSFPDGDLDFENLNFDETFEEDKTGTSHENLPTKEDDAVLHQEATVQSAALSSEETIDVYMADDADEEQSDDENDEEDFQGIGLTSMDKTPQEDYTSSDGDSEQEGSSSQDDEEEGPGDLLMSVDAESCDANNEDRIFAEGQPLAPEGAENPQLRNEEQGESDEEVSYFEKVPERGCRMMIKGDEIEEDEQEREEEKQEDLSDSECESMKIKPEENALARCLEQDDVDPRRDVPEKASLEFPEISVQNLQDLIAEVDSEEHVEKVKDFSGEEHQEAGESFADYPSDFSSCEYVEDGGKTQETAHQSKVLACASDGGSSAKQDTCLERAAVTDRTWMVRAEDADEEADEYLYSVDLEVDAEKFRSLDVATGEKDLEIVEHVLGHAAVTGCDDEDETSESDSYSSSDDEVQGKRSDEELDVHIDNMCLQDFENNKQPEETHGGSSSAFARWSTSDDYNRVDAADLYRNWNLDVLTTDTLLSEDLLTTEDTDRAETLLSDVTRLTEVANSYSLVQRGEATTTSLSNQGSLDDSFFFNTELEGSGVTELGQLGDDEYEEERNWEQEQERIKAFYKFYDDSDVENEKEGRQKKVQFCTDPLSQVIQYDTDSSDRDSLSSSTDREEDLSSAESSEEIREQDDTIQMKLVCDAPNAELPETVTDLSNTPTCTRKHKCLNMLKLSLKMGVVILMGLLMFWLATDQGHWFSPVSFF